MARDASDHSREDHGSSEPAGHPYVGPAAGPSVEASSFVPLAEPMPTPPGVPEAFGGGPGVLPELAPAMAPSTLHLCLIDLRAGCYRLSFTPNMGVNRYHGTMRVDKAGGSATISGDLYQFLHGAGHLPLPLPHGRGIPIYPRNRYYSYLRVTNIQQSPVVTSGPCQLTLTAQEYVYTQPPPGSFDGTFPAPPGTRTVTLVLEPKPAPLGFLGVYFEGKLFEGGTEKGAVTMAWVSHFFRRATLEIDTLTGAVAPTAVPAHSGSGTESFRTVFDAAGWHLHVIYDQVVIPVPAGVTPNVCWSNADLHALMLSVRKPTTDLDKEWRMHLVVVPATMGCGRGVMYDTIAVPREGVASFSDDGYPSSQSANFGTAADQRQRDVPRAFMRSACHEVGHGFNQIHQEQELGADNSIMTTTPSVADVLGGPSTGEPGVFPSDIALQFNDHVRHHLVHFPDIVVRPGGMTFGSGHSSTVPEADRHYFGAEELELGLEPVTTRIALGEPLRLAWALVNRSRRPIPVPSDLRVEAQHAFVTVTDPHGVRKLQPSFVIQTGNVSIQPLGPGQARKAETRVFWSSRGFAFQTPGKHVVEVRVVWTHDDAPYGARASADVWVDYPQSASDNEAAATLLHPQVGMYVALGGGASHLREAVARLERVRAIVGRADRPALPVLRGYAGLAPAERANARRRRTGPRPIPRRRRPRMR